MRMPWVAVVLAAAVASLAAAPLTREEKLTVDPPAEDAVDGWSVDIDAI